MFNFKKNYFDLFQLPISYQLECDVLLDRYNTLLKTVHPDRFSQDTEQQKRIALQYSSYINQAFNTLKSPVTRMQYLLEIHGINLDLENNTLIDNNFLLKQMELRELIDGISQHLKPEEEAERLHNLIAEQVNLLLNTFESIYEDLQHQSFNDQVLIKKAKLTIQKTQFMHKLSTEIYQKI